jgi:hypothetical protein
MLEATPFTSYTEETKLRIGEANDQSSKGRVIHGDIKEEYILTTGSQGIMLIDLGSAEL